MKPKRKFDGIWFPKELYLNTDLAPTEKLLVAEINCLDGKNGCFASNQHFANFLDISIGHVANLLGKLRKMGIIIDDDTKKKRTLHIKGTLISTLRDLHVNLKDNNTLNSTGNTSNNKLLEGNPSSSETDPKNKKYFPPTSIPYALADYQLNSVLDIVPNFRGKDWSEGSKYRECTLQSWSIIHDKILRLDKRNPDKVMDVIDFVAKDTFWCCNVLSAGKLREQYDKLLLQMKKKNGDLSTKSNTLLEDPDHELTQEIIAKFMDFIHSPNYDVTHSRMERFIQTSQKMTKFFSRGKGRIPKTAWVDYLMECMQENFSNRGATIQPGDLCAPRTWDTFMTQYLKCLGVWYE